MTPEQASFLLHEIYLPQIRREFKATRRVIESVPADQLSYRPDVKSMTAWELATHLAGSEVFFMLGVAKGKFERAEGAPPESVKNPAALAAWYEESFRDAASRLDTMKPEELVREINFAIFNLKAIEYVSLLLRHSIHHRGQLSAYLRPMGSTVPAIYGGSADEPLERPAKA